MKRPSSERNSRDRSVAIGYIRVSTDEQSNGVEAQCAAIESWAAREGVRIASWHVDRGVSGASAIASRPGLLDAIAAAEAARCGLVAAKRDRIARDAMIAAMVERDCGVVRTADGASDGIGPEGALMRTLLDAFAAYERELIKARTKAALAAKLARGERLGAPPYGYRFAGKGADLEPIPAEQAILAAARRCVGLSLRQISRKIGLNPRTGKPFSPSAVSNMLQGATDLCAK